MPYVKVPKDNRSTKHSAVGGMLSLPTFQHEERQDAIPPTPACASLTAEVWRKRSDAVFFSGGPPQLSNNLEDLSSTAVTYSKLAERRAQAQLEGVSSHDRGRAVHFEVKETSQQFKQLIMDSEKILNTTGWKIPDDKKGPFLPERVIRNEQPKILTEEETIFVDCDEIPGQQLNDTVFLDDDDEKDQEEKLKKETKEIKNFIFNRLPPPHLLANKKQGRDLADENPQQPKRHRIAKN